MNADAIGSGGCAAWALPMSRECAQRARRLVHEVTTNLGLADDLIQVIQVVTSELVTNTVKHGSKQAIFREGRAVAGLPELWVYQRGSTPRELVLTAYDAGTTWTDFVPAGEPDELLENGRGLEIVAALAKETGGRWGHHPTRSRLGEQRLPGTAAWFALPLPPPQHPTEPMTTNPLPGDAIGRLAELLRARGLPRLIGHANGDRAVLSVAYGLTVWFQHATYCWDGINGPQRHPAADVVDTAEHVLAETEHTRRRRQEI